VLAFTAILVVLRPHNAAPEWQAGSLGSRSRELLVACPLEGLVVRPVLQATQSLQTI
jgi:hypothetical protein